MAKSNTAAPGVQQSQTPQARNPVTDCEISFLPPLAGEADMPPLLIVPKGVPLDHLVESAAAMATAAGTLARMAVISELMFKGGQTAADVLEGIGCLAATSAAMMQAVRDAQQLGGVQ